VCTFSLSAAATVTLGLADLTGPAALGFSFSALVTASAVVDPFFNWRTRWMLADRALADWYALQNRLRFYLARGDRDLDAEILSQFSAENDEIWEEFSSRWIAGAKGVNKR
jgi:hypothetical protein